jgi:hypothetical protein
MQTFRRHLSVALFGSLLCTIQPGTGAGPAFNSESSLQVLHPPAKRPPPLPHPWPGDRLEEQEEVRSA